MLHRYFAASNSSEGFKSYYREVFDRAERLYVIKGGPGTGKSSLMKRIAAEGEREGFEVEYYYCSSDPSSLDGILMSANGDVIGMVDGTAPHVWEPTYSGAKDEIVNLGEFWDSGALREQKNEIFSLSNKKSAAFKRAYSYLRSCGNLRAVTDSLLRKATDFEKLQSAAERLARSLELEEGRTQSIPALVSAISMQGRVRLDTIEQNSQKLWRIGEFYGVGQWFLDALIGSLHKYKCKARISYDCIEPRYCDGVFLEGEQVGFVLGKESESEDGRCNDSERYINPKRFVRTDILREIRGEMRYAARIYSNCLDGALHALGEAKVYHFLLEDIYRHTMDFPALTDYSRQLIKKIF